ncbi:MAG TPA: universal stress protein [Candidatus Binataceae bacterium]|jgi:universal stress protein A|nr:universal stress protein [Candidatus Binataceae bacterium]
MFKRILSPIDFDDNSLDALRTAAEIARRENAKLYVLHVAPLADPIVISAPFISQRAEENARTQLQKIAKEELSGVDYELLARLGHPADEIVAAEADIDADLVIMATHGRTGFSHLLIGSVAEKVVRESACPVLIVRKKKPRPVSVEDMKRPAA